MNSEKHEFQQFGQKQLEALWHLSKGFASTTVGTLYHVITTLISDLKKSKNWYETFGVFVAVIIVGAITFNSVTDIYWWGYRKIHESWYEQQFVDTAEQQAREFFNLYSKSFAERDCSFMKKVGVDEAMYDKYQHTEYDDYPCNNYYKGIRQKFYLPYEIRPLITSDKKMRIQGKALVLRISDNDQLTVSAQVFELWKTRDWDLWRFNATSKQGSTQIPIKTTAE